MLLLGVMVGLFDRLGSWGPLAYNITGYIYFWAVIIGSISAVGAFCFGSWRVRLTVFVMFAAYAPLVCRVGIWIAKNAI